ncbi:alpha,alpha-trehalase TreF [Patescibacteria group bacterium]|nr:MAG: alpha,alpha-trehalase TreF [Patescibacteria group bacterium]
MGHLLPAGKSPEDVLGELFADVQMQNIYVDSKTFVDLIPKKRSKQLLREYKLAKKDPNFNLHEFVRRHFYELSTVRSHVPFVADLNDTISQHISKLWLDLERRNRRDKGSLIALPYTYVVPGGRFDEQYYWDSYFIMLGLATEERWDLIEGMMKNFVYMIRKFGFIPTANRTYFLSRSQPPFFSHMVRLLAGHKGKSTLVEYLPFLLKEYRFWTKGRSKLAQEEHRAYARLVEMDNGSLLGRYYDNRTSPRPESLGEDTGTAEEAIERDSERLYLHLRAGAESGWDFSSRWFENPKDIRTIHTADIIPVDLNCLLYQLELTIVDSYRILKQPLFARKFQRLADRRAVAINEYCWDDRIGFYTDYNFHHHKSTGHVSLAGVFPLFAEVASIDQAARVAEHIERDFLKEGGLVSSLVDNGQQWDAPNGWAPLQYIAIIGLRNYGYFELANKIKSAWLKTNKTVFEQEHKLVEKYNVIGGNRLGGGGEYPLQDGFGWTNGVFEALSSERD